MVRVPVAPATGAAPAIAAEDALAAAAAVPAQDEPGSAPKPADLAGNRPGRNATARAAAERDKLRIQVGRFKSWQLRHHDDPNDERRCRLQADGERLVGKQLDKLRRVGCLVLHSLPLPADGTQVDHLVICPGGVFALATRHHPGGSLRVAGLTAYLDDEEVDHVRSLADQRDFVLAALRDSLGWEPPVTGVLVVVDAAGTTLKITEPPEPELQIVLSTAMPDWFHQWLPLISEEQMLAVYEVARWSSTWQAQTPSGVGGEEVRSVG